MFSAQAISRQRPSNRFAHRGVERTVLTAGAALGLLLAPLHVSRAQESIQESDQSGSTWAMRFTSGALVPVGKQRNSIKDAQVSAAQLAWRVGPSLSITGSFSWARSRVLNVVDRPKVDVFNSDLGVELRMDEWFPDRAVTFRPFAGAGAGVRTYNYRSRTVDASNHPAGYLAIGGDLGLGRVGVRLEARDYASRFTPLVGDHTSDMRNDVVISAGLHLKKRRAPQP
jgi:hypothetical protein